MIRQHLKTTLCGLAVAGLATQARAVLTDNLPLQKGFVVATCFSSTTPFDYIQEPNGFVVLVTDATQPELLAAGVDLPSGAYNWKRFHNEVSVQNPGTPSAAQEWTAGNLGEVFGITLDDAANPNIYVAATTAYGSHPYPAGNGAGTVYQLDGTTGNITAFNCIPNGGASLGNLTFWRAGNGGHLYVTSMDDGLIYQLDTSGTCIGTYDHGVSGRAAAGLPPQPDDPAGNYTQRGRRLWGIEAHEGRLYYGVWTVSGPEVWSVALDASSGAPIPASAQIDVPLASFSTNYPVSDIAFSANGEMYTAHRYHRGLNFGGQHAVGVHEFVFAAGSWNNPSPVNKFRVGNFYTNRNSAGGVDVECTGAVWATADAINFPSPAYYGAQRIPAGGNMTDTPATQFSQILDFDGLTKVLKSYLGDIEVYDPCDTCFDISELQIDCPQTAGDPYSVTFKITNRSNQTAHYIWHNPCPQGDLPPGAITGQPTVPPAPETGPQLLPVPIATGECTTVTVNLPAPNTGGTFCWNITLLNESGGECCTDKACIELPDCDCFIVLDKSIECTIDAAGVIKYTLQVKIQNTSSFDWHHVNLLPPTAFTPATFNLGGSPVPPGAVYIINTCVSGNAGDALCFNISVHSEDIELCCSKECCILLPPCEGGKPDECELTKTAPCCPDPTGVQLANAVITICNNSALSRTYGWNLAPLPAGPGCPDVLPLGAAAFSPPSGSITVGPNSCVNIPVTIDCEGLIAGKAACYEVCVRQVGDPDNVFCCQGRVIVPLQPDPHLKDDPVGNPGGAVILDPAGIVRRTVQVINPSDRPVRYVFEVIARGEFVQISSPNAGNAEFLGVQRLTVDLEPFETEIVSMDLRAAPGLPFDNTLVPLSFAPLGPDGESNRTIFSLLAIAPSQQDGAPALKGIAANPDGTFTMTLATDPGRTYRIESSLTLGSVDAWGPVTCSTVENGHEGTEFLATGTVLFLTITPDPACPENFFRVVELP